MFAQLGNCGFISQKEAKNCQQLTNVEEKQPICPNSTTFRQSGCDKWILVLTYEFKPKGDCKKLFKVLIYHEMKRN